MEIRRFISMMSLKIADPEFMVAMAEEDGTYGVQHEILLVINCIRGGFISALVQALDSFLEDGNRVNQTGPEHA
jgi:hypothetical protein